MSDKFKGNKQYWKNKQFDSEQKNYLAFWTIGLHDKLCEIPYIHFNNH